MPVAIRQEQENTEQMPRGDNDGSIIERGSGLIVRKRYTDQHGISREKKRAAKTRSEAVQIRRELEYEIAAELVGVDSSQVGAFRWLVSSCHDANVKRDPAHQLAATLLNLESGLERLKQLLPELDGIDIEDFCNSYRFRPASFVSAIMNRLHAELSRVKTEEQEYSSPLEQ